MPELDAFTSLERRPLVVTLRMDAASAAHFTAMRKAHFPPERNWLDAHITLFHALPGEVIDAVLRDVEDVAADTPTFTLQTDRLLFFGAGVAYALRSDRAEELRRTLASKWTAQLTRQDRAWRGPLHITVQNKAAPAPARALHGQLTKDFAPRTILAVGIDVWYYEQGPWRHVKTAAFAPFSDASGG